MLKVKVLIVLLLVGLVLSAPSRKSAKSDDQKPVDPPSVESLSASNEDKSVRGAKGWFKVIVGIR